MKPVHWFAAGLAAIAIAGGALWWYSSRAAIHRAYAEAEALCAIDPTRGGRLISSLDAMYGEGSRPSELRWRIGSCKIDASIAEMHRLNAIARSLD